MRVAGSQEKILHLTIINDDKMRGKRHFKVEGLEMEWVEFPRASFY
jgi:hypothetical protein